MIQNVCIYNGIEDLRSFIEENELDRAKQDILVHIYAGNGREEAKYSAEVIFHALRSPKIIGVSTDDIILAGEIIQSKTVIVFHQFQFSGLELLYDPILDGNYAEAGKRLLHSLKDCKARHMYNFTIGTYDEIRHMLRQVSGGIRNLFSIGGGVNKGSFIIYDQHVVDEGMVSVAVKNTDLVVKSDGILMANNVKREGIVTKAEDGCILEIDSTGALLWIADKLGIGAEDINHSVSWYFPLLKGDTRLKNTFTYEVEGQGIRAQTIFKEGDIIHLGFLDTLHGYMSLRRIARMIEYSPADQIFVYAAKSQKEVMNGFLTLSLAPFTLPRDKMVVGALLENAYVYMDGCVHLFANNTVIHTIGEDMSSRWEINHAVIDTETQKDVNIMYHIHLADEALSKKLSVANKQFYLEAKNSAHALEVYSNIDVHIDPMTRLRNQAKLLHNFELYGGDSITLIEIKDFSDLYAFYGVHIGDELIMSIVTFLKEHVDHKGYKLYIISPGKFAVTESYNSDLDEVKEDMKTLRVEMEEHCFTIQGLEIYLDVLVSFARNERDLLEKANLTLQYIETHHEKFAEYHPQLKLEEMAFDNIIWIKKIRDAIRKDRIVPFYQAIVNNQTGEVEKYECLIRMIGEDGNVIFPQDFLDIAKRSNLYFDLTKIMVEKCFARFENEDIVFAINVTTEDLVDADTSKFIIEHIKVFPKPQNIVIELVESEKIETIPEIKTFFEQVKRYNVKIAIDDFGTGYSNLKYLIDMEAHILKIDGTIIKEIANDETNRQVVRTIVNLAKFLQVQVVAEFVENEEIFNILSEMGVEYSQGYYFSKATPELIEKKFK